MRKEEIPTVSTEELLFNLIYRVRELDKELKKANSKIRKLEKALDYKKIAKFTNRFLGKKAKRINHYHDTTWKNLEEYLGF